MKMLAVQVPIPGGQLRYSTAEVLAHGLSVDRHFLILYDTPGRVAEISLATRDEPHVEGDTVYQYWDPEYESAVFGVRFEKAEKQLVVNGHLVVIALPRERALRTWVAEFPSRVIPYSEENKPFSVPLITDAYMFAGSGVNGRRIWADLDFLPGAHELTLLLPSRPDKCWIDGELSALDYDRDRRTARLRISTPAAPYNPIDLMNSGQSWVERFDTASGQWQNPPILAPLEDTGPVPYGYVKYKTQFNYSSEQRLFVSTFADDGTRIFINGRAVEGASKAAKQVSCDLAKYARAGTNSLEIAYECFGAANGGKEMGDLRGIESVRAGSDPASGTLISAWQIQRFAVPMRGREVDLNSAGVSWSSASSLAAGAIDLAVPAFTWCRKEFELPALAPEWLTPWKLTFEADCDALIYLNGKFVGRYVTVGPQKQFYLPGPYFLPVGAKNLLTFVMAYTNIAQHLRTLRVEPYDEFSARRTRLEFQW